jgi:hypothetical protein
MKGVYWGDLGADDRWVDLTIPQVGGPADVEGRGPDELRDGPGLPTADLAAALLSAGRAPDAEVRDMAGASQPEVVANAAIRRLQAAPGDEEIRDGTVGDPGQAAAIRDAITDCWASTTWLRQVSDLAMLEEIGAAITAPLADSSITVGPGDEEEVRDAELRGMAEFVRHRIDDLDRVIGATIGSAAGRLNSYLRTEAGPGVARFIGDVLVYQRHRKEIHDRVWDVVHQADPALGRGPDRPVRIVGHSLGGVIAVDLATADEPLWTRSLVTFGSQAPFFHVCDPRGGQLQPYASGTLVKLPPSLGAWTNLWEPIDPLAFIAAKVFRMPDGSAPRDLAIGHLASSGLLTHSSYWDVPQVATIIQEALNRS